MLESQGEGESPAFGKDVGPGRRPARRARRRCASSRSPRATACISRSAWARRPTRTWTGSRRRTRPGPDQPDGRRALARAPLARGVAGVPAAHARAGWCASRSTSTTGSSTSSSTSAPGRSSAPCCAAIPEAFFNAAAHAVGLLDAVWAGTTFKPANKVEHPDPSQRERDTDFVVAQGVPLRERRPSRAAALERAARPGVDGRGDDRGGRPGDRAGSTPASCGRRAATRRDGSDYADARTLGLAMAGKILAPGQGARDRQSASSSARSTTTSSRPRSRTSRCSLTRIGRAARESLAAALQARGDEDLGAAVLGVRSATVQLGPSLTQFALH